MTALLFLLAACGQDTDLEPLGESADLPPDEDSGSVATGNPFAMVEVGTYAGCAVRRNGEVACWGGKFAGEEAVSFDDDVRLRMVGITSVGVCGLSQEGRASCIDGGLADVPEGKFETLSVGGGHACVMTGTTVTCWGEDAYGELSGVPSSVVAISCGGALTCALDDASMPTCWGKNDYGQALPPSVPLRSIVAARDHTSCGVDLGGEAVCWGANRAGTAVAPPGPFVVVQAGFDVTCGLHEDGTIECWGNADRGLYAAPEGSFASFAVDSTDACAVSVEGALVCWGDDLYGRVSEAPTE